MNFSNHVVILLTSYSNSGCFNQKIRGVLIKNSGCVEITVEIPYINFCFEYISNIFYFDKVRPI